MQRSVFLCLLMLVLPAPLFADEIESVKDMRVLEQQAEKRSLPVLLLFTTEDCEFCHALREHYLLPMKQSGDYNDVILFRQLYMDTYSMLRDRQGKLVGGDELALEFSVSVSPTILFVDAQGRELAERIVGVANADYFDKTLQIHIEQASKNFAR